MKQSLKLLIVVGFSLVFVSFANADLEFALKKDGNYGGRVEFDPLARNIKAVVEIKTHKEQINYPSKSLVKALNDNPKMMEAMMIGMQQQRGNQKSIEGRRQETIMPPHNEL